MCGQQLKAFSYRQDIICGALMFSQLSTGKHGFVALTQARVIINSAGHPTYQLLQGATRYSFGCIRVFLLTSAYGIPVPVF